MIRFHSDLTFKDFEQFKILQSFLPLLQQCSNPRHPADILAVKISN
ncbi:hypothetical protein HanHA300_Chr13g0469271 [Helianthus annuus]|nr:hypothetical protein HanHA300_Chr13g0469271 [Helianthus annuus]KAJ0662599.1 hypothetical protein HanLR1_Chr13g0471461 [Helianthus annuus]